MPPTTGVIKIERGGDENITINHGCGGGDCGGGRNIGGGNDGGDGGNGGNGGCVTSRRREVSLKLCVSSRRREVSTN